MGWLQRRLSPLVSRVLLSSRTRSLQRLRADLGRRLRGQPPTVDYFHQVDDPTSHLVAQLLPGLKASYEVELRVHLVGRPPDEAAPDRERLVAFSRRDAASIAPAYGLRFEAEWEQPPAAQVQRANERLAAAVAQSRFVEQAVEVGEALWSGSLQGEGSAAEALLAPGSELRARKGHYLGGTLLYNGEWFWGPDRFDLLEDRLSPLRRGPRLVERPSVEQSALDGPPLRLDFFLSARSPYSYLAMERTFALAERYPLELVLRPVLPMVSRGLAVPRAKRLYLVRDAHREAERLGIPFAPICDPLGEPLERMFSLFPWAREQGRAEALLLSFAQGAWSEAVDGSTDAGLSRIVERAGLDWTAAREVVDNQDWREELEANRQELLSLGLWGVPCFRLSGGGEPFSTWGQDRLWLLEREIRRRMLLAEAEAEAEAAPARG